VPLIEITARAPEGVDVAAVLAEVNHDVAATLGCRPDAVWSTWRTLAPGEYVVGSEPAPPSATASHVPVVHVWINRPPDAVERCVAAIETALRRTLALDADPFVTTGPVRGAMPD
jgi:hypothetical protein